MVKTIGDLRYNIILMNAHVQMASSLLSKFIPGLLIVPPTFITDVIFKHACNVVQSNYKVHANKKPKD